MPGRYDVEIGVKNIYYERALTLLFEAYEISRRQKPAKKLRQGSNQVEIVDY